MFAEIHHVFINVTSGPFHHNLRETAGAQEIWIDGFQYCKPARNTSNASELLFLANSCGWFRFVESSQRMNNIDVHSTSSSSCLSNTSDRLVSMMRELNVKIP